MKKTETIALYKESFLAGKPEEVRRRFEEKDMEKQYSSIIAWRRRQKKSASIPQEEKTEKEITPASIIQTLEKVKSTIPEFDAIAHEDREVMLRLIGEITSDIHNFDRIKKSQLLSKLESEQEEMNRQRDSLQQRIDSLRQELNW